MVSVDKIKEGCRGCWLSDGPGAASVKASRDHDSTQEDSRLFPQNWFLQEETLRKLRKNTEEIAAQGRTRKIMAEREGFEPPVPFQARTLSRRLVSTTHPSLRGKK